jgi:hypothetical protein
MLRHALDVRAARASTSADNRSGLLHVELGALQQRKAARRGGATTDAPSSLREVTTSSSPSAPPLGLK